MKKFRMLGAAMMVTLLFASCSSKKESTSEPAAQPASSTTQEVSNSGSENWDEVLKSYEGLVNQYIALAPKVAKGDASALQEYSGIMEKATELSEKLDKAKENALSPAQAKRLIDLETKMAKAAAEAMPK
jgi:ABC-type glycerol-3-phosphate transport system substrate-binding protein